MHRSARTGRAVSAKEAKSNPETTVKESKSKDTLRLDFLQKHDAFVARDDLWRVEWGDGGIDHTAYGASLRQAINAAMKAEKVK